MCMIPRPRPAPGDDQVVPLVNADCPKCGGPVHYSKAKWLHCPKCDRRKAESRPRTAA